MFWEISKDNKTHYEAVKNIVTCTICTGIIIDPQQCNGCEKNFCKKCIEDWLRRSNVCPIRCSNSSFKESRQTKIC